MLPMSRLCAFVLLAACLLLAGGCAQTKPTPQDGQAATSLSPDAAPRAASSGQVAEPEPAAAEPLPATNRSEQFIRESERNRAACFRLQPAAVTTKVIKRQVAVQQGQASKKKGAKIAAEKPAATGTKVVRTTGRCQPQSLIYARCRTGIMTCRLGDTSPVQWFACARANKATTSLPAAGYVIVLDVNARRGMPTGHPAYVEEAHKNGDGTWTLRISHTNYDRKCHLDQDAMVVFDPRRMTATFTTGPWATWARDLKALGFIVR